MSPRPRFQNTSLRFEILHRAVFCDRAVGASNSVIAGRKIPVVAFFDILPFLHRTAELDIYKRATVIKCVTFDIGYAV